MSSFDRPWYAETAHEPGRRVNQRELAMLLGVDVSTAWEWSRAGMPVAARGERGAANVYDLAACVRWAIGHRLRAVSPKPGPRERLERLRALQLQREIDALRKSAVDPGEASVVWAQLVEHCAAVAGTIAAKFVAQRTADSGVDATYGLLEDLIVEALQAMAEGQQGDNGTPAVMPPDESAASVAARRCLPAFDAEVAAVCGVRPETVAAWRDAGLPAPNDDTASCDVAATIEWWVSHEARRLFGEPDRDRLARMQGDKIELELQMASGELVACNAVESIWCARVLAARSRLLTLPERMASLLASVGDHPAVVEAMVQEDVDAAMACLSGLEDGTPEPSSDDSESGAGAPLAAQAKEA